MPGLEVASVEIHAHRGHFFPKRLSLRIATDNHQTNRALEACAAPIFNTCKLANTLCGSGHGGPPVELLIRKTTTVPGRTQKYVRRIAVEI